MFILSCHPFIPHDDVIPLIPAITPSYPPCCSSCGAIQVFVLSDAGFGYRFHLFMRLCSLLLPAIFAPSLKQTIMKGKYINTVIMMAALSGNRNKKAAIEKETITSLNNHKIIWRKAGQSKTTATNKPASALL